MPYEIKPVYRQLRRSFVAYWSDFLRTVVIPRLWEMSYHLSETIRVLRRMLRSLLDERLKKLAAVSRFNKLLHALWNTCTFRPVGYY